MVSILTQPLGWVQPNSRATLDHSLFQSSPNLSVGCSHSVVSGMWTGFQSSPNLSVGCILRTDRSTLSFVSVSILTQPLGWVQPEGLPHFRHHHISFNPHPTSRLGAARRAATLSHHHISFNPTQPLGWGVSFVGESRFNSHSTSRLSAASMSVTSRSRSRSRSKTFESSPNLALTCVNCNLEFQSSPNFSVGCSIFGYHLTYHFEVFQFLPNLSIGCSIPV